MNKKALIVTLIILLGSLSYLYINKYYERPNTDGWQYVTEHASFVIEINNKRVFENHLEGNNLPIFGNVINELLSVSLIDSANISEGNLAEIIIPYYKTGKDAFENSFIIPANSKIFKPLIDSIVSLNKQSEKRIYLEVPIFKLNLKNVSYSYLINKDYIVISKDPLLIEDVIRVGSDSNLKLFSEINKGLMNIPKLSNDAGNIYFNIDRFNDFLNIFSNEKFEFINSFGFNSFFDFSIDENALTFNGFTNVYDEDFAKTFINQKPVRDRFDFIIPSKALYAKKHLVSDASLWNKDLIKYWKSYQESYSIKRDDFLKKYKIEQSNYFNNLKDGLCYVELIDGPNVEHLTYVSVHDTNDYLTQLNRLTESISLASGDSVYSESFGNYLITEINLPQFPKMIYGNTYDGYKSVYFLNLTDYIVFGSSINVLKELIRSIESEKTWGRELVFNNFYSSGLEEINIGYNFNTVRLWPLIIKGLNSDWREYFSENEMLFKRFKLGLIQLSRIDNNFYTNISFERSQLPNKEIRSLYTIDHTLTFTNQITSKPHVVKNHNSNLLEVLIQDSLNNISLISNEGKKLWSVIIDEKINSDISQIDFYKNGKLQYFFTTEGNIFIIDRLGNFVEDYPKKLEAHSIGSRVVDYDNSKSYRFVVTSSDGNIHLYNKHGKSLEGWNPLKISGHHAFAPFHVRIRGKDCFVTLLKDGTLSLYNRRGQILNGFPKKLDDRFNSEVFIEPGADYSKSFIHIVSESGKFFKVNFEGEILDTQELFRQTKEVSFEIIPDALNETYVIARRDKQRLVILNQKFEEVLAKDYLSSETLKVQYYYFSPENIIYSVTDKTQGFTYLYKSNGELVNSRPLSSDNEIGLLYSESTNEYTLYVVSDATYSRLKF